MATLTLTVSQSTDDAQVSDTGYDDSAATLLMGSAGSPAVTNGGQGLRFQGVSLGGADTINLVTLSLMKSTATWTNVDWRLTAIDEDNTAAFSSGSPPGARAIVSASIAAETLNINHADGSVYTFPSTTTLKQTLAAAVSAVLDRAGWASGNALGIVNNSAQDAGRTSSFSREFYHSYDSSTASSEPQLIIDYTAAPATIDQEGARFRNDDGSESTATWKAAQDTNINLASGSAFRLRMLLDTPQNPAAQGYQLGFKKSTGGSYVAAAVPPVPALAYGAEGAVAVSAASATTVSPAYPTGITTRSILLMIIGQKPTVANTEQVTLPSGWSLAGTGGLPAAGGYGSTLGVDTGNTNLYILKKDTVTGSETGTVAVTITNTSTTGVTWAQIVRIEANFDIASVSYSMATTSQTTTPTSPMTLTFGSDPGVTAGDYIIAAMCIPTDVTTPAQFSAQSFSQTGVTFGAVTEISEPDSSNGNDIGGVIVRAAVTAGTSSAAPSLQMTLAGTLTNVRGPAVFLRVRFTPVPPAVTLNASANIAASAATATTAQLTPPSGKTTSDFTAGLISDDTNPLPNIDIAANGYTEVEWSLKLDSGLVDGDIYQFQVTVGGTALTTYTVTPQITVGTGVSAIFAGTSTLSGGSPQFNSSVSIAGVAVLSGGTPRLNTSASFAGTSALSGTPVFNASVSSAGVATLSTNPGVINPASATFVGTSTLSPGSPRFNSSATLAGTSTLAIGTVLFRASAAFVGTAVLTTAPVFNAGAVTAIGTSTLAATPVFNSSVSVAGAGVLSPGSPRFNASAPLAGVGTLAASNAQLIASAAFAGVGVLTEGHTYSGPAGAAIDGTSTLVAIPLLITPAAANFVATGTLAATGRVTAVGSATLAGTGILSAVASSGADRSIAFPGAGVLTAIPVITNIGSFNAVGTGTFTATPRITNVSTVLFVGVATVQASAAVTQPASAAFVGTGTFTAAYQYGVYVSASAVFAGAGALSISSYGYFDALPAWAGTSIGLTAYAETSVSLTAFAETTIQPTAYAAGSVRVA